MMARPRGVAVYSAIYGDYDTPKPLPKGLDVPAFMFTDNPNLRAPGWQVVVEPRPCDPDIAPTPMLQAKWWKTHPRVALGYPYHTTIWIDGSVTLHTPDFGARCVEALKNADWAGVPHPLRRCVYDEVETSKRMPRYDAAGLEAQATYYRSIGHPNNWGLLACGVITRRNTPAALEVSGQWWWECVTRTIQDQVSLPVLLRLAENKLNWNTNIPWGDWWTAANHPAG